MRRPASCIAAITIIASLLATGGMTASAVTSPAISSGSATFTYTGGPQDWPIPRGVQSVYVTLVGAPGGSVTTTNGQGTTVPIAGGSPAQVTGTLALAPGTGAVDVWVGGPGGSLTNSGTPGAGGFNGGAPGGSGDWSPGASLPGGGGGGATDLRIGGFLPNTRVMVAGGGGGAGGAHQANSGQGYQPGGSGGNGGTGTPSSGSFPAQAGGNASGDNAGAGGAGGFDSNGQGSVGGSGGDGTGNAGGGGGAGGWFGGQGGQAGKSGVFGYAAAAGGGGGGSSYASPSQVTNASATLAAAGAAPSATFQWVDISTTTLPTLRAGTPVSQQLSATFSGPPGMMLWQVSSGSLPAGLSLSSDGVLSGTPTRAELFSFTVSASASTGVSPAPLATSTVTFSGDVKSSSVPSVPTSVAAVGGVNTATVTWVAPVFTGGTPLVNYQVRWSSNAGATWSTPVSIPASQTSYSTSLTGGLNYVFQVAASNQTTTSLWSASSNSVAVTSVSNAPSNVSGTPGYESVALTWTAPSQTGGAPVTGYMIRYSTDGGGAWATMPNTGSTATSATIGNLTSQAGYIFEVSAVNSAGMSPWSPPSSIVYPILDPNAPTDVVATPAYQGVELTWIAPPNPSVPVTGYLVRYSANSGTTWSAPVATNSTLTTFDYDGLTQPDFLIFEVAAVNANGTSAWSTPSAPVAPDTRASAPTKLRATAGNRAVVLTWNPPIDLGGGTLTGYRIDYRVSGTTPWKTHTASTGTGATRFDVTQLRNGTSYDFRVAAITNTFGVGLFSQSASASPFDVPGIPTNVRASARDAAARLTWQAPATDNGRRIVGYRIEAATSTGWYLIEPDTRTSGTTFTATGLINGQTYLFRVSAINIGGAGEASAPSNAVTPSATAGALPRHVLVKPGRARAQVQWQRPAGLGQSSVSQYLVESSVAGGPWSVQCTTTMTSCRIDGLSPTLPYRFRVAAVTESGISPWTSPTHPVIPGARPTPPTLKQVALRDGRAVLTLRSTWLGDVRMLWQDPGGTWRAVRGGAVTLPSGVAQTRVRADHRGTLGQESLITVDRPRNRDARVDVTVNGDRSSITGSRGDRFEWRYDSSSAWRPAGDPLSLRDPWPLRPWNLHVRDRDSREVLRIAIR